MDSDEMREHLASHGVFNEVDEFYDRVERGEDLEEHYGPMLSPAEVSAWVKARRNG